jgi:hypothetical protein
MSLIPVFALLSAIRRDPFAVSFTTLRDLCRPEFPLPASRLSFEQTSAKPHESCQALQNEHLQKSSHNSREMNTYKIIGLKVEQNEHLQKKRAGRWTVGSDPFAITRDRAMINVP